MLRTKRQDDGRAVKVILNRKCVITSRLPSKQKAHIPLAHPSQPHSSLFFIPSEERPPAHRSLTSSQSHNPFFSSFLCLIKLGSAIHHFNLPLADFLDSLTLPSLSPPGRIPTLDKPNNNLFGALPPQAADLWKKLTKHDVMQEVTNAVVASSSLPCRPSQRPQNRKPHIPREGACVGYQIHLKDTGRSKGKDRG